MSFTHFVPINSTHGKRITVTLAIVSLLYLALVGAFFLYLWSKDQNAVVRQEKISACLASGGHVGQEDSCRYDRPIDNTQPEFMRPSLSGAVPFDTQRQ